MSLAFVLAIIASAAPPVGQLIDSTLLTGSFEELLQHIASAQPSVCGVADSDRETNHRDLRNVELAILNSAAEAAAAAMNHDSVPSDASADRLRASVEIALASHREMSARTNARWPEEARFRAETHVIPPIVVLKLAIRDQEAVFTVGYRELSNAHETCRAWHAEESPYPDDPTPTQIVDVFPIHRGASNRGSISDPIVSKWLRGKLRRQV